MFGYGPKSTVHRWRHTATVVSFRLLCPNELCLNNETKPVHYIIMIMSAWQTFPWRTIINQKGKTVGFFSTNLARSPSSPASCHKLARSQAATATVKAGGNMESWSHPSTSGLAGQQLHDPRCMAGVWHKCEHWSWGFFVPPMSWWNQHKTICHQHCRCPKQLLRNRFNITNTAMRILPGEQELIPRTKSHTPHLAKGCKRNHRL